MLTETHRQKFQTYKKALKGKYGPATYDSWFKPLGLADYEQHHVVLSAPSGFAAKEICKRFSKDMIDLWEEEVGPVKQFEVLGGDSGAVAFASVRRRSAVLRKPAEPLSARNSASGTGTARVPSAPAQPTAAVASTAAAVAPAAAPAASAPVSGIAAQGQTEQYTDSERREETGLNLAAPLNAMMTFNRFCVSDSNRLANAAARAVVEGKSDGLVYIHGAPGRGKTHLLNAIGQEWLARRPADNVMYLTHDKFLNGYVTAVLQKSVPELRSYLDRIDILIVDDVHLLRGRKATQEELLSLIDRLMALGRAVVIAGSTAASTLAETGVNYRLADRLGGGFSVQIDRPDFALRLKILREMARYDCAHNRICLDDRYLQMIARRCDVSIREVEGAYRTIRLKAETCQDDDERGSATTRLTEQQVSDILQEMLSFTRKEVTLEDLRSAVADMFGLSVADLTGRSRPQAIVKARHAFCIAARKLTDAPLKAIGACLNRDHTTVLSSLDRGEVLAETDAVFGERISRILDEYGQ